MANRYWILGSGTWDASSTAHWSATSGGASGASAPTSADDVFFDSNSGLSGSTVTIDAGGVSCNNFTSNTGVSYTIDNPNIYIYILGSSVFESTLSFSSNSIINMVAIGSNNTVTTNGVVFKTVQFGESNGSWTLQDDMVCTNRFYQDSGTFNANDKNITANDFYFYADTGGYTPTVNMGSGTWTSTTASDNNIWYIDENNGETVTINSDTSTIYYETDGADITNFFGGGKIYYNLTLAGTGGAVSNFGIYGSNTFNTFSVTTYPHKVFFDNNTTQTVTSFDVSGVSGSLITLAVAGVGTFTLSKSSGTVNCDYLDISNSIATGGATWNAGANSIDNGGNSGWIFSSPPATNSNFLMFMK